MTTKRTTSTETSVAGRLIGLALEVPPIAYAALTGDLPAWARIWMSTWLSLWLILTVVQAAKAPISRGD